MHNAIQVCRQKYMEWLLRPHAYARYASSALGSRLDTVRVEHKAEPESRRSLRQIVELQT